MLFYNKKIDLMPTYDKRNFPGEIVRILGKFMQVEKSLLRNIYLRGERIDPITQTDIDIVTSTIEALSAEEVAIYKASITSLDKQIGDIKGQLLHPPEIIEVDENKNYIWQKVCSLKDAIINLKTNRNKEGE